jgi:oligoribonuclease
MHALSGLWLESMGTDLTAAMADADLYTWVCSHHAPSTSSLRTSKIMLAGNSVHYDREVLRRHFPRTFSLLHYRQIDLTSLNEMAWRFSPSVLEHYQRGAPAHRALPDALESLELARYYAKVLGSHAAPLVVLEDAAPKT